MTCDRAEELITALVDGQLSEPERGELESHFKACSKCRFALAQERNLKKAIFAAGAELHAPSALRQRLLSDPRLFGASPSARARALRPWRAAALAAALLLVVGAWFLRPSAPALGLAAVTEYPQLTADAALPVKSSDIGQLSRSLAALVDNRFQPMGYDFAMMQLLPVGGSLKIIAGREVLVTRYHGGQYSLLCFTFLGGHHDAPAGAAVFHDAEKGVDFFTFSVGSINAVLHREDQVICVLAAEIAMSELLGLARAKAKPHKHL